MPVARSVLLVGIAVTTIAACGSDDTTRSDDAGRADPPGTDAPTTIIEQSDPVYEFEAAERADAGGLAINIDLTVDGQPFRQTDGGLLHLFMVGEDLGYYRHDVMPTEPAGASLSRWYNVGDTGLTRLVTIFDDADGSVALETDVSVSEASDFDMGLPTVDPVEFGADIGGVDRA